MVERCAENAETPVQLWFLAWYAASIMIVSQDVTFTYTNWRGETRARRVRPIRLYFGSTEYHDDPQWLLVAKDLERDVERTFAMKDIKEWAPPEAPSGT